MILVPLLVGSDPSQYKAKVLPKHAFSPLSQPVVSILPALGPALGLVLGLSLGLGACGGESPAASGSGTTSSGAGSSADAASSGQDSTVPERPTYYQDVAPIFARSCVGCHQKGGAGFFVLDDYAKAKEMAAAIRHAVSSRSMPPWLVQDDGQCGEYKESQALSETEIRTIERWVETGAAAGERAEISYPPIKALTGYKEMLTPEYVPQAKGGKLAATDEYRCFFLKNPSTDKRRFLNGYEIIPGNAALVHHAVMFVVPSKGVAANGKSNEAHLKDLDAQSPDRAGWPCYSMVGEGVMPADLPIVWAPGQGAVEFAPESGSIIDPDDLLVLQVHYNLADPSVVGKSDQSKVRIRLTDSVKRQSLGLPWDDLLATLGSPSPVQIPPGSKDFAYSSDIGLEGLGFAQVPYLDIHGFMPHMHEAGRSQRLEILQEGGQQCLSYVPTWDFDWQLAYFFREPIRWMPGTKLRNTCTFDTSTRSEVTLPGWGTRNEMCLATLFVLMPEGIMTR